MSLRHSTAPPIQVPPVHVPVINSLPLQSTQHPANGGTSQSTQHPANGGTSQSTNNNSTEPNALPFDLNMGSRFHIHRSNSSANHALNVLANHGTQY